jgi:hypothetical protein
VSPAPDRAVVVRHRRPPARTLVSTRASADRNHHPFGRECHARDGYSLDSDDAVKCSSDAHVVPLGFGCLDASETTSTTCASFDETRGLRGVAVNPSGD